MRLISKLIPSDSSIWVKCLYAPFWSLTLLATITLLPFLGLELKIKITGRALSVIQTMFFQVLSTVFLWEVAIVIFLGVALWISINIDEWWQYEKESQKT